MKIDKNNWYCMPQVFALPESPIFNDNLLTVPVRIFINTMTEEVKLFTQHIVEQRGVETITSELAKRSDEDA